eukprot:TRINITY_DN24929_c0_g1_i1.p1 TRINITY_DN24929_c0_g1~~TRINITY_DN24929_c0_g1_i1.p1  ORF type:complete len:120 (-),score=23.66 TRINITY_DN24929_c0_g1_i1:70-429(-)
MPSDEPTVNNAGPEEAMDTTADTTAAASSRSQAQPEALVEEVQVLPGVYMTNFSSRRVPAIDKALGKGEKLFPPERASGHSATNENDQNDTSKPVSDTSPAPGQGDDVRETIIAAEIAR